jgi:hypothetical protein
LAADVISPRCAAVQGYLTSLLLRTLPAQYNDPCPQAGTPMSAAQMAEREKAISSAFPAAKPSSAAPAQKPAATQKPVAIHDTLVLTDKHGATDKIVATFQPANTRASR